jgi:hypothetical protein
MAIQLSTTARNNRLDQIENTIGASAKLQIRTGAAPANCAAANTGSLLIEIALPADWMNAASSGTKTLLGTWSGAASGTGTAAHFRIFETTSTTCGLQGTVGQGSGDMSLDNTSIASGQTVAVTTFTLTDGNA